MLYYFLKCRKNTESKYPKCFKNLKRNYQNVKRAIVKKQNLLKNKKQVDY